jgi:microcin C transport system substrate-binding protein
VRFRFAKVNRELHLLAADIPVFSREWLNGKTLDEVTQTPPLGSGPYVLDNHQMGKTVRYKRNPHYWGNDLNVMRGMYNFDFIGYKYYQDHTISLEALKAGEFDFMDIYSSKQWARDMTGPKFDQGELVKVLLSHQNNAGMQGFVFNLRRPLFQDIAVRRAINLAFDFGWTHKNLFFNQYTRCNSYFSNSEMAATGLPQGDELALLTQFKALLPPAVFNQAWTPVSTEPPHSLRQNLRQAQQLLDKAGWKLQGGTLEKKGVPLAFEVILAQREFERILAPFAKNLKKLGIDIRYRTVDTALYKQRLDDFDFDMTVASFAQSLSPGNEQYNMWHSRAATQKGSQNFIGLQNPVVDALVDKLVTTKDRQELLTVSRALDRVLLHGDYLVPNWYIGQHRVAYRDKFAQPATVPLYYPTGESWMVLTWWIK